MKTTLVVAALNEIDGMRVIMPRIKKEWVDEILVVDGGSTDGSYEYAVQNGYKVVRQKSKGLANAYFEAMEIAEGDVLIPFSPDGNSVPERIPALVEKMKEGYDMVVVSRYRELDVYHHGQRAFRGPLHGYARHVPGLAQGCGQNLQHSSGRSRG